MASDPQVDPDTVELNFDEPKSPTVPEKVEVKVNEPAPPIAVEDDTEPKQPAGEKQSPKQRQHAADLGTALKQARPKRKLKNAAHKIRLGNRLKASMDTTEKRHFKPGTASKKDLEIQIHALEKVVRKHQKQIHFLMETLLVKHKSGQHSASIFVQNQLEKQRAHRRGSAVTVPPELFQGISVDDKVAFDPDRKPRSSVLKAKKPKPGFMAAFSLSKMARKIKKNRKKKEAKYAVEAKTGTLTFADEPETQPELPKAQPEDANEKTDPDNEDKVTSAIASNDEGPNDEGSSDGSYESEESDSSLFSVRSSLWNQTTMTTIRASLMQAATQHRTSMFTWLDKDGSNSIDIEELKEAINKNGMFTDDELVKVLSNIAPNGLFSRDKFYGWWNKANSKYELMFSLFHSVGFWGTIAYFVGGFWYLFCALVPGGCKSFGYWKYVGVISYFIGSFLFIEIPIKQEINSKRFDRMIVNAIKREFEEQRLKNRKAQVAKVGALKGDTVTLMHEEIDVLERKRDSMPGTKPNFNPIGSLESPVRKVVVPNSMVKEDKKLNQGGGEEEKGLMDKMMGGFRKPKSK